MVTSTDSMHDFPEQRLTPECLFESFEASALPPPQPVEADTFARQEAVPGHLQAALTQARIVLVGGGGLNSWAALGLARSGARFITVVDDDWAERTNLPRQLFFAEDLGQPKGIRLAHNLSRHAVAGGLLTGFALRFEQAAEQFALPADVLVVGVDNNACRLYCARYARAHRIPAVFTMLSRDGMRCQSFLQGPDQDDACLWCALPNLNPESSSPCAAAIISSCFFAAAFTLFFVHRALMGWPLAVEQFNWREGDLLGVVPDLIGKVSRRPHCPVCGATEVRQASQE